MDTNPKYLIVITGPTAVGKTALSIELALEWQTEIISADSRQLFRELNIGSAKPATNELNLVKHHFINHLSISEEYSAGAFERESLECLRELFASRDLVFMTGGSGLYIQTVCEGLDYFPDVPDTVVDQLNQEFEEQGIEPLREQLKQLDPMYYDQVDLHNHRRIIRALSVILTSGETFSSFRKRSAESRPFQCKYIILNRDRTELYERINQRVEQMVTNGLFEEAHKLMPFKSKKALQTVGYQECFDYFNGKISREEAIELIKRNTRRYAKRQLTWFRKLERAVWLHPEDKTAIDTTIKKWLDGKQNERG